MLRTGKGECVVAVLGRRGARTAADGNAAAAHAAYALSDAFFVYPITPSTGMSQTVEARSARGERNAYGRAVLVRQMQSEAGVAGALHGALQSGVLAASFTASQGLLLMVPTLYKVAGEGLPLVLHVTARAVSANGVTIHADHSDVYAVRQTGVALLSSHSVQECADLAVAAHIAAATAATPVVHFFEGMQLSHEVADCALPAPALLARLAPREAVARFRARSLSPARPRSIGTVLGRDTFWPQAASDAPRHARVAQCVDDALAAVARATGRRRHGLFDYYGSPRAERVVVAMGAHAQTVQLAVRRLLARGERVGVVKVHLFRPWSAEHFCSVLPPTVRRIAVLDRAHEPLAAGDPLYLDVLASVAAPGAAVAAPRLEHVVGGHYAIGDHDFSVAMAESVFAELAARHPRPRFAVGIVDDLTHSALPLPSTETTTTTSSKATGTLAKVLGCGFGRDNKSSSNSKNSSAGSATRDEYAPYKCVFWGIGGDGTVSANRNTATILCEHRDDMAVRAAFHYDAHKTGGVTLSHLQFQKKTPEQRQHGDEVVMFHGGVGRGEADFVACHVPQYLAQYDVLAYLKPGGTVLLNVPCGTSTKTTTKEDLVSALERQLPPAFRAQLARLGARLFVIDGTGLAEKAGLGRHTSTVLGAAFLRVADCVGTPAQCAAWLKALAARRYGQGSAAAAGLLEKNAAAVDMGFAHVAEVHYPRDRWRACAPPVPVCARPTATGALAAYDRDIGARLRRLEGMHIPASAMLRHSEHGLTPCGTAALEKRGIAAAVPAWDPAKCVQCNRCAFFCPHAAIRPFLLKNNSSTSGSGSSATAVATGTAKAAMTTVPCQGFEKDLRFRIQVSPLDCTACGACVKACPTGALAMRPAASMRAEARHWDALTGTGTGADTGTRRDVVELRPSVPRDLSVRTSQLPRPLLEFAGACAGCPEPVYTKLLTQLYGDRLVLANGIGCSTVWSGTAFCSPVACGADGRGPAWGCSLFENNAEYGYGMALGALVRRRALRATLLRAAGSPRLSLAARAALTACLATWDEVDADARAHIAGAVAAVARELGTLRREMANNKDRKDVAQLVEDLEGILRDQDLLLKRTHWIVGGDGWAHDIGFGGLDHVLATRTPVRVLVLDNENYANTGGQQSKATSIGAVAKLASRGKATPKKDLGLYALAMHPHAYVASVCYGADPAQTLRALRDADAHDGPALVVAYCPCIEHQPAGGFSGATAIDHMRTAVRAGYWPLYTRTPGTPLRITSRPGTPRALDSFLLSEGRFSATLRNHPERALLLRAGLQAQIATRDRLLAKLAEASAPPPRVPPKNDSDSKNNNKATVASRKGK